MTILHLESVIFEVVIQVSQAEVAEAESSWSIPIVRWFANQTTY